MNLSAIVMQHDYRERLEMISKEWHRERVANGGDPHFYSAGDLYSMPDSKPAHGDTWGRFTFRRDNLTLEHSGGYYIDLERCKNSAQLLDWIFQIEGKTWMTVEDKGHLIEALQDLLYPQQNLCSFGTDKRMNATKYLMDHTTEQIEVNVVDEKETVSQ